MPALKIASKKVISQKVCKNVQKRKLSKCAQFFAYNFSGAFLKSASANLKSA
jgi:hypothetical protein